MALFEGKTPAERNKMIAAIVLPLIALIFVVRMLFFGSSTPTRTAQNGPTPRPTPRRQAGPQTPATTTDAPDDLVNNMTEIVCCSEFVGGADAGRNIFAFYVKPTPTPNPLGPMTPTPTPTPPPPLVLASLAPQSVFARTAGF